MGTKSGSRFFVDSQNNSTECKSRGTTAAFSWAVKSSTWDNSSKVFNKIRADDLLQDGKIFKSSTSCRAGRHSSSGISLETSEVESIHLLNASLASGTLSSYRKSVENFIRLEVNLLWPKCGQVLNSIPLNLFLFFLSVSGKAAAFISSSISALVFVNNVNGWEDPTASFLISKLKEGCRRLHPQLDGRLPLKPNILKHIINSLPL